MDVLEDHAMQRWSWYKFSRHRLNYRRGQLKYPARWNARTVAIARAKGPLFDVEIDGDRKNLFSSRAAAKQLQAAVVAQDGKALVFEHSEAESKLEMQWRQKTGFLTLACNTTSPLGRRRCWSG